MYCHSKVFYCTKKKRSKDVQIVNEIKITLNIVFNIIVTKINNIINFDIK